MNQKKNCKTCFGYGFWAMGDKVPMGPMDAEDGLPTLRCPECGANQNPVDNCERTIQKRRRRVSG